MVSAPVHASRAESEGGFSLVELLVTVVIATIVFAAMVPLFANVLNGSFRDAQRNYAQLIAQDRIEQIRLLAYPTINPQNLNSPSPAASFGDGRFGTSYTLTGQQPYTVTYTVSTPTPDPTSTAAGGSTDLLVTVAVKPSGSSYWTTMQTIVNDPAPHVYSVSSSAPSPLPSIAGLTITTTFKDWSDVNSSGVVVKRVQTNVTPNVTFTPTPVKLVPTSASPTCLWTGLTGGTNYIYTVTTNTVNGTFTSPMFHLLQSARLYFDTNPGGS